VNALSQMHDKIMSFVVHSIKLHLNSLERQFGDKEDYTIIQRQRKILATTMAILLTTVGIIIAIIIINWKAKLQNTRPLICT